MPPLLFAQFAIAGAHHDVEREGGILLELELLDAVVVVRRFLVQDTPLTVDYVALELMRQNPGHRLALELLGALLEGLRHLGVFLPDLHEPDGGLGGGPRGLQHIGASVRDLAGVGVVH